MESADCENVRYAYVDDRIADVLAIHMVHNEEETAELVSVLHAEGWTTLRKLLRATHTSSAARRLERITRRYPIIKRLLVVAECAQQKEEKNEKERSQRFMAQGRLIHRYKNRDYVIQTTTKGKHYIEVPSSHSASTYKKYIHLTPEQEKKAPLPPVRRAEKEMVKESDRGNRYANVIIRLIRTPSDGLISESYKRHSRRRRLPFTSYFSPYRLTSTVKDILQSAFSTGNMEIVQFGHQAGSSLVRLTVRLPKAGIIDDTPIRKVADVHKLVEDVIEMGPDTWQEGETDLDKWYQLDFELAKPTPIDTSYYPGAVISFVDHPSPKTRWNAGATKRIIQAVSHPSIKM